jgi:hypothetical protein
VLLHTMTEPQGPGLLTQPQGARCKHRLTLGDTCLRGGKSHSNMGDTVRVSVAIDIDIGEKAPDGGGPILARQASSLVQYAAERR